MQVRQRLADWLKHYSPSPAKSLGFFTGGGFLFAGGLMVILLAEKFASDGLTQEIIALFGLIMVSIGGSIALWGYLNISLIKVIIYILEPNSNDDKRP